MPQTNHAAVARETGNRSDLIQCLELAQNDYVDASTVASEFDELDQRTLADCEWVPAFLVDLQQEVDATEGHYLAGFTAEPRPDPRDWIMRHRASVTEDFVVTIGHEEWLDEHAIMQARRGDLVAFIRIAGSRRDKVFLRLARDRAKGAVFIAGESVHSLFRSAPVTRQDEPGDGAALIQEARLARDENEIDRIAASRSVCLDYDPGAVERRLAKARTEAKTRAASSEVPVYLRRIEAERGTFFSGMIDDEDVFRTPSLDPAEADAMEPAYRAALETFATELRAILAASASPAATEAA